MVKFVALLKRRDGMSFEEFVEYYETKHAILGRKHIPTALKYQRRFLMAAPHPIDGSRRQDYDCITELWFESQAAMEQALTHLGSPGVQELVLEDEEKVFDREMSRCFFVDSEHESVM